MAVNLKTLLVTTTIGTGIIGGGVGVMYSFKQTPKITVTIEQQLRNEKKKLLVSEEQSLWNIKLSTYNTLKTTNTKIKLATNETWSNLKTWCKAQTKLNFDDENKELYEGIKKVCTVPSNKEKLTSLKKILATETQHWEGRKTAYQLQDNRNTISKIPKEHTDLIGELKKWCSKELEEEFTAEGQGNYDLTLKWCTKDGQ